MKRVVLMVMLLVAGGLALVYLAFLTQAFLSFAMSFGGATGSGGIGSVSAGVSEAFVESVLVVFPSFLLWRICASLAAGGDRVMARHRRIHGVAVIAVLLLIAGVIGLFAVAPYGGPHQMPPPEAVRDPEGLVGVLLAVVFASFMMLPLTAFCLAALQLFSAVVAFRILMRGGHETLETS